MLGIVGLEIKETTQAMATELVVLKSNLVWCLLGLYIICSTNIAGAGSENKSQGLKYSLSSLSVKRTLYLGDKHFGGKGRPFECLVLHALWM